MKITGIVLAGGKSSRMGTDKGLIDFRGKPLVQYPLELLRTCCDECLISTNNPDYSIFGLPLVKDTVLGKGPVAGLIAAMQCSSGDWNVVVGCDMPFLNQVLTDLLISSATGFQCVVPIHDGLLEPTAAIYHKSMAGLIRDSILQGNNSLRDIIVKSRAFLLPVDELMLSYPLMFSNINTPGDFRMLEE